MDLITTISLAAGLIATLVAILTFLYMLIWGQKSIKEVLNEQKKERAKPKNSSASQRSTPDTVPIQVEPIPAEGFVYDAFISYNSTNKEWVQKTLNPVLERAGLKVCDQHRDFHVGVSITKEVTQAISQSRKTILIFSPGYLRNGWAELESLMLQTPDAANQERRLVPVILEICELPLRIKHINRINFANPDDMKVEWQRLLKVLGVTLPMPARDTKLPDTRLRNTWHLVHPYAMLPNFTGRAIELKMLDDWLADDIDRLFILRALGGFGKSALVWQWINTHVNPTEWTKLVWWSFYEGDASFEHFVEEALRYLKIEIPQGLRTQVDELLRAMQEQKFLLIMDGFERELRAYSNINAAYQADEEPELKDQQFDCVNLNAEIFLKNVCSLPGVKSKVLMTTRLTPRAVKQHGECLQGCHEEELTAMQKEDAIEFFRKQKIKGIHAEIEAACAPYGYHPLSLRLLAGRILKDLRFPGDISVAQTIKIDGDLKQQRNHVLEIAYRSLPIQQQNLLGRIACFRSPVTFDMLKAISELATQQSKGPAGLIKKKPETGKLHIGSLESDLQDLIERGFLHHDEAKHKYDLHPIVRHYAYEHFAAPIRALTHVCLRDYFASMDESIKIQSLDDLHPVIELYYHTVRAEETDKAFNLFHVHLAKPLYYQLGEYQLIIELLRLLFTNSEDRLPSLKEEKDRAWVLNTLANAYSRSGQPFYAITFFEEYIQRSQKETGLEDQIVGLENLAAQEITIGALRQADSHLRQAAALSWQSGDKIHESVGHQGLGYIMAYRGTWYEAGQEFEESYRYNQENDLQGNCIDELYQAICSLLMARDPTLSSSKNRQLAVSHAQQALNLAEENAQIDYPVMRDILEAHWLLGAAYRLNDQLNQAESHLSQALARCRAINLIENEANILLDLARLRYDQRKFEEARSLAEEAMTITKRCGYILQGADVNLFLAQYALEQERNSEKAKQFAGIALRLSHCENGPPYYYKVAYGEAERMLARLNA